MSNAVMCINQGFVQEYWCILSDLSDWSNMKMKILITKNWFKVATQLARCDYSSTVSIRRLIQTHGRVVKVSHSDY